MASRFWVGGTGTWDASDTTHWAASSGTAGGQSVPGSSDTVTIDGSSGAGTITVNTTVTVQSITCGAMGMTLDFSANDNNVTLSASGGFNGSGSGTRTINLGDGTWTFTTTSAASTPWTMTTTTNLTFAANASTMVFQGGSLNNTRSFNGGGLTYNNLTVTNAAVTVLGANTFNGVVTLTAPAGLLLPSATTTTMTTLTSSGSASSASQNFLGSSSATAIGTVSIAAGTQTLNWTAIRELTFTGGATFVGTNSFDGGGTTGITITAPSGSGSVGVIGG